MEQINLLSRKGFSMQNREMLTSNAVMNNSRVNVSVVEEVTSKFSAFKNYFKAKIFKNEANNNILGGQFN